MADDVKKLLLQIDASCELLKRNLREGEAHVERFERDTDKRLKSIDKNFSLLGKGANAATASFRLMKGALAAIGISFGVSQMMGFVKSSFDMASGLAEASQQLGVSTKALQVYRYVASQVGVEQEAMDKGLGKLNKTLGEAALGAEKPTKYLKAFGFSLAEIRRGLTVEEALPRIADGLAKVESSAQRAAVETAFFGKAGQQLDTMLAGGGDSIRELAAAAERLGLVLSDDQIARLDEAADKMAELKKVLEAKVAGAVAENVESITALTEAVAEMVATLGRGILYLRNFKLAWEANRLEGEIRASDNQTPGDWGMGSTPRLTPQQRMSRLQRLSDIAEERLRISRVISGEPEPGTGTFWSFLQPPSSMTGGAGAPDIDDIEGSGGGSTQRTAAQAHADFEAELLKRGIRRNKGRTGIRSFKDQADIFRQLGPGKAAPPGNSAHERAQALDLPEDVDWSKVVDAARAAGISGLDKLVHNRHTHAFWSGHGAKGEGGAAGPSWEDQQKRDAEEAERRRKDKLRHAAQIDSQLARARADGLRAQQDLSDDTDERAKLGLQIMDVEREQYRKALELDVNLGELTKAERDQLLAAYDVTDALNRRRITEDAAAQKRAEAARLEEVSFELQQELLQGQADLATTAAERRRIELRILELLYAEERKRLERLATEGKTDGERAEARQRLAALPLRQQQDEERTRRGTRGPLQDFLSGIPQSAEEVDEALEKVAAGGLASLTDGITEAIMGAKSLGDVFHAVAKQIIADLIRIAVQRAVVALANVAMGGSPSAGGTGGGDSLGTLMAAFGGGRATGGRVSRGSWYMVGEKGPEPFIPDSSGTIIPHHAMRSGGAGSQDVRLVIEPSEMFDVKIQQVGAAAANAGAEMGVKTVVKLLRRSGLN